MIETGKIEIVREPLVDLITLAKNIGNFKTVEMEKAFAALVMRQANPLCIYKGIEEEQPHER